MTKGFTKHILLGMLLGVLCGILIKTLPLSPQLRLGLINNFFSVGGEIFLNLLKMMVVPIVLVSLICGVAGLGDIRKLGRLGIKAILLYVFTTIIAISLALIIATLLQVGSGAQLQTHAQFSTQAAPSLRQTLINLFPVNPFSALERGNMLQIIVFAILFGIAITAVGERAQPIVKFFNLINDILMKLIMLIMLLAPYGVFFLLTTLFAKQGLEILGQLLGYFVTVLVVLMLQLFGVYSLLLRVLAKLNPVRFFRNTINLLLFAFSVSSSNASIPVTLRTAEKRLGVSNQVAAFVVPLGATINMDGTAIMQGVATVFIAHAYGIHLGLGGYLTVILMATLASIGTAGVPSVGLVTLAMVLQQVNLPVNGIALIIGVDRLLDMARTAVNVAGDSTVACVIASSENQLNREIFGSEQREFTK